MIEANEAADLKVIRQAAGPHVEDEDWRTSELIIDYYFVAIRKGAGQPALA